VIAVAATTLRYTTVIREMNLLFNEQVMIVSKDAIVIQALPIGGGMLPQNSTKSSVELVEGVEVAVPVLFLAPLEIGGIIQPVPINFTLGIPVEDWHLTLGPLRWKGGSGRIPHSELSNEVVVGPSMADQYDWAVGAEISVNNHYLRIVGILDTKIALLNRCFLMPLHTAQAVYDYPGSVNIITAKPLVGVPQEDMGEAIEQNIDYVKALTEEERNDIIEPVLSQVESWNVGVHAVIFVLALILVTTVTGMSVSERRRDFATLDAIGAPLGFVVRAVLLEASLIGAIGGVMGIGLGSVFALVLASLYTEIPLIQFFPSVLEIVPPVYVATIFSSTVALCCLGGLIPALNATKMRIAEVLRADY
jgi:putative ABC transport system permease protein